VTLDAGAFARFRLRGAFIECAAWYAVGVAASPTCASPAQRFRTNDLMFGVGAINQTRDHQGFNAIAEPFLEACASVIRRAAPALDDPALTHYRTDDGIVVIARAVKIPRHVPPVYSLVPMKRPGPTERFRELEIVHALTKAVNDVVRTFQTRAERQAQGL
jgi:hypothetical protein